MTIARQRFAARTRSCRPTDAMMPQRIEDERLPLSEWTQRVLIGWQDPALPKHRPDRAERELATGAGFIRGVIGALIFDLVVLMVIIVILVAVGLRDIS